MTHSEQLNEIRAWFDGQDVQKVKIGGFDVDGVLRGKYISTEKFWSVVEGGLGFCDVIFGWDVQDELYDRETVTGWKTGYPDATAFVDPGTFRTIPWEHNTPCFLLDFQDADGTPNPVSPRQVLKRVIDKATALGFDPVAACEFEFFIYQETPDSIEAAGYRDPRPLDPGMMGYSWLRTSQYSDLTHALLDGLRAFRVPVEGFHTETGPGVFEAALRYEFALEAADRAALFKTAVKEICHRHGCLASFMAKPSAKLPGCSGHTHQSLMRAGTQQNAFFDAEARISNVLEHYVAGQLQLMPEVLPMLAPNINSYKRLVPGLWAPTAATWGIDNRTCALRVITGSEKSTRVEHRVPGADMNPYLAIAGTIGTGLYGIEHQLPPPPPTEGNAYAVDEAPQLGRTLREATTAMGASEAAREIFGANFVDHFVLSRDFECRQAEKAVTDWETERYFELA